MPSFQKPRVDRRIQRDSSEIIFSKAMFRNKIVSYRAFRETFHLFACKRTAFIHETWCFFFSLILVALFVNNPNKCFVSEAPCFWTKRSSTESVFDKFWYVKKCKSSLTWKILQAFWMHPRFQLSFKILQNKIQNKRWREFVQRLTLSRLNEQKLQGVKNQRDGWWMSF